MISQLQYDAIRAFKKLEESEPEEPEHDTTSATAKGVYEAEKVRWDENMAIAREMCDKEANKNWALTSMPDQLGKPVIYGQIVQFQVRFGKNRGHIAVFSLTLLRSAAHPFRQISHSLPAHSG